MHVKEETEFHQTIWTFFQQVVGIRKKKKSCGRGFDSDTLDRTTRSLIGRSIRPETPRPQVRGTRGGSGRVWLPQVAKETARDPLPSQEDFPRLPDPPSHEPPSSPPAPHRIAGRRRSAMASPRPPQTTRQGHHVPIPDTNFLLSKSHLCSLSPDDLRRRLGKSPDLRPGRNQGGAKASCAGSS
jgi:hypothetical protein